MNKLSLLHPFSILKSLGVIIAVLTLSGMPARSQTATNLAFLGTTSSPFEVDSEFTFAPYTQGNTTLTLGVPFTGGLTLFGAFGSIAAPLSFDWSGVEAIAFSLSSTVAPTTTLAVEFYASDLLTSLGSATVAVGGISSTPSSVELIFEPGSDIANLTDVGGLYLTWGGDSITGDTPVTIHSVDAVPEPSTWAMLILGGLLVGGSMLRRRLAVVRR